MRPRRIRPLPLWLSLLLSPLAVFMTTWLLSALQVWLSARTGGQVRPYGIGFVVPIALMTALGGRRPGLLTLILSVLAAIFLLIPRSLADGIHDPRNLVELILMTFVGILVILGIHAMRRNAHLLADVQARAARETLLHAVERRLRESDDPAEIQETAARELGLALHADRCFFMFRPDDRDTYVVTRDWRREDLSSVAGEHEIPRQVMNPAVIHPEGVTMILEDAETAPLTPEFRALLRRMRHRSVLSVPFFDEGRLVGSLTLAMADAPRLWTLAEVELAETVATRTRTALEAARVHDRERRIAEFLQDFLLPVQPEPVPGLDLWPYYRPALDEAKVGGDFYDVFSISEEVFALVIGDVSGKGLAAAVQVATVRTMLRCLLYREPSVGEAVRRLNDILAGHGLMTGFTTLFVAFYQTASRLLTFVSCGHEPGLLRRADTGAVEELAANSPVLGVSAGLPFGETSVTLKRGDLLALYTDGLTDAGPDFRGMLGVSGLSAFLRDGGEGKTADVIAADLVRRVEAFAGGSLRDDACLLVAVV